MHFHHLFKKVCKSQYHGGRTKPARARLSLESLEDRVTPSVSLIGNALFITGDDGGQPVNDNTFLARNSAGGVLVDFNGQVFNFAAGQVAHIEVDPEMGQNTTTINATPAGVTVSVFCLQGPDTVNIGNGNLDNLGGNVFVAGDLGANVTVYDQAAPVSRNYTLNGDDLTWGGTASLTGQQWHNFTINGGPLGNTFNIDTAADSLLTSINPGLGHNTINVGSGDLSKLGGEVAVNSNGGTDSVVLQDASQASAEDYTVTYASVSRGVFYPLVYSGVASVTINGAGSASATSTYTFDTIASHTAYTVNANAGNNLFFLSSLDLSLLSALSTPVALNGANGANNQLNGPDAAKTIWTITGVGSGKLGSEVSFTGMRDLLGGTGENVFVFYPGGSVPGTINGGGGGELVYKPLTGPVVVNLQTQAASDINGGAVGGFSNIREFVSSASSSDTLLGPEANTTWEISGTNSGAVVTSTSRFAFFGFENLVGGLDVDVFSFIGAGSVTGTLNGGGTSPGLGDWLNYSGLTKPVTVNLQTGSATGVAGGAAGHVKNIQNVHGGNGGNTLTGDSQGNILIGGSGANTLTGGSGRSILIADKGPSHITGGSSDGDILIGDYTAYDSMTTAHELALMSILAEWQSADSYAVRFHDINTGTGGGLNGTNKLNWGTTVKDDPAPDAPVTLTASSSALALDWFFLDSNDTKVNYEAGEHVNNT
jgi:hypothetical protein